MNETTHAARLRRIILGNAPDAVRTLELTLLEPEAFSFSAGQYSAIALPDGNALTLSIASGPTRLPHLRFLYRSTPGNPAAEALDEMLRGRTAVELHSPGGRIRWDTTSRRPALLVCAGTGIAQAFAILETIADRAPELLSHYRLLALAGSAEEQIGHPEEVHWINAGLELIRLTDPSIDADNAGMEWLRKAAPQLLEAGTRVLIGGAPPFVYAVHDTLAAAGLDESNFAADAYEYAPR